MFRTIFSALTLAAVVCAALVAAACDKESPTAPSPSCSYAL